MQAAVVLMWLRSQMLLAFVALLGYTKAYGIDANCNARKCQNRVSERHS